MTTNDCKVLSLLDTLPRRLPTQQMVVIVNSSCPRIDMLGMCSPHAFIESCINLAYFCLFFS